MSEVDTILKDYNKIIAEVLEIRKEATEKIKNSLNGLFKNFFENTPEVVYMTWDQYTPFFNDGDTCEFSVHEKYYITEKSLREYNEDNESAVEDLDRPTGWSADEAGFSGVRYMLDIMKEKLTVSYGSDRGVEIFKNISEMQKILDAIPEEIYMEAFGDHARIIVDRDGITIEEADHD